MDGELLMVPGAPVPQMILQPSSSNAEPAPTPDAPERKQQQQAKKWYRHWVTQDTVLNSGKCQLPKWINEETMHLIRSKHFDDPDGDSEYEAVYVCTYDSCGKIFTEAPALRKHAHVHGEKQYICHYEGCGKRFVDSSKLKRHFLIHTGEKHFQCKVCGKAFSLDFNLRSHMRTHTGENYHTCPYENCGKRYAHEYKLRGHLKTHHDKVYPDGKQVCLEPENTKASALAASGAPRKFACPYEGCDKRYYYEYKLNLHLKRSHAKEELLEEYPNNGSDEFSEGSEENGLQAKNQAKGKSRISSKTPSKKKRNSSVPKASTPKPGVAAEKRSAKRKRPGKQEDSEDTEDESRFEMDVGFEDDEETEDEIE